MPDNVIFAFKAFAGRHADVIFVAAWHNPYGQHEAFVLWGWSGFVDIPLKVGLPSETPTRDCRPSSRYRRERQQLEWLRHFLIGR